MAEPFGVDHDQVTRDIIAVQKLLRQTAPDLRKKLDKEIRSLVKPITDRAKSELPQVPLSRWHTDGDRRTGTARLPGYEINSARRGIRLQAGSRQLRGEAARAKRLGNVLGASSNSLRTLAAYSVVQANAGGAVYEVAGRRTRGANTFITNLERKNGRASRGIWRAWDALGSKDKLTAGIIKAVTDTMVEYDQRMRSRRRWRMGR